LRQTTSHILCTSTKVVDGEPYLLRVTRRHPHNRLRTTLFPEGEVLDGEMLVETLIRVTNDILAGDGFKISSSKEIHGIYDRESGRFCHFVLFEFCGELRTERIDPSTSPGPYIIDPPAFERVKSLYFSIDRTQRDILVDVVERLAIDNPSFAKGFKDITRRPLT